MAEQQITREAVTETASAYRIDVNLHDVLMDPKSERSTLVPDGPALTLPEPVYPQREYSEETDATLTEYQRTNAKRTWRAWGKPYFQSRSLKNRKELRPIIAYLFTEFKCNLSCHDFHINEEPMIEQEHFNDRLEDNSTFLRPEDYEKVDDILDWVIDRHKGGQTIVNPNSHLHQMKDLMRG